MCIACRDLLPTGEPLGVCPTCWAELPFWKHELEPMPHLPKGVDSFAAPFLYEKPVKNWITRTKFSDRTELAPVLAEFMLSHLPKIKNALLVPVPLHSSRLRGRLFNQSAMLVRTISKRSGVEWHHAALHRVQKTRPQVSKTRKQRQQLPNNAFYADEKLVNGRNIILVDDIWTTGSTARACATVLKKAGAKRVDVLTATYVAP